jgi:hypothetical protein
MLRPWFRGGFYEQLPRHVKRTRVAGDKQAPDLQAIMFSHADKIPTQPLSPQDAQKDSRPIWRT